MEPGGKKERKRKKGGMWKEGMVAFSCLDGCPRNLSLTFSEPLLWGGKINKRRENTDFVFFVYALLYDHFKAARG